MSFTYDVKHEICQTELDRDKAKARLAGLLLVKASLHMNWQGVYLSFQIENATIAKHVWQLLRQLYDAQPRLSVLKKMKLKKNNIYRIQVFEEASAILEDLQIMTSAGLQQVPGPALVADEDAARAFLQGCFLASGSVNSPKTSNYHLEISVQHEALAQSVQTLMERFYLPARIAQRKNLYVIYLKAGEKIADFLRLADAGNALMAFEDTRISRDFYNQMRRLDNCELANEMKSMSAARKQLASIEILEQNMSRDQIPEKIRDVMEIRKAFPEYSVIELCDEIYRQKGEIISKSGMKHRLSKIREMAMQWQEETA